MHISIEQTIALLHEASHGTLATQSAQLPGYPYATVVPYVMGDDQCPLICVSRLAEHTRNLLADPKISLSVLQPDTADVQAASRLTLIGDAEPFDPSPELLKRYLRYAPATQSLLALDFIFVRLRPARVRIIEGIGRMGWLDGGEWRSLPTLQLTEETRLIGKISRLVKADVTLLGIDCHGIDYKADGHRKRYGFTGLLQAMQVEQAVFDAAPTLA